MILFAQDALSVTYLIGVLVGAGGVIAFLFRALIKSKDDLIIAKEKEHERVRQDLEAERKEEEARKKVYQEMANEGIKSAIETANFYRKKEGKPPIIPVPPVISESNSPSTSAQRETAEVSTMRAKMEQVKRMMGQEARQEPPRDTDSLVESHTKTAADLGKEIASATLLHEIAKIPEETAEKVVEKLEEQNKLP